MLYVTMVTVSVIFDRIKFVASAFRVFMSQINNIPVRPELLYMYCARTVTLVIERTITAYLMKTV